jgi:hypothetical protein
MTWFLCVWEHAYAENPMESGKGTTWKRTASASRRCPGYIGSTFGANEMNGPSG